MDNTGNALLIITAVAMWYAYGFQWIQFGMIVFGIFTWHINFQNDLEKEIQRKSFEKLSQEVELLRYQNMKNKK